MKECQPSPKLHPEILIKLLPDPSDTRVIYRIKQLMKGKTLPKELLKPVFVACDLHLFTRMIPYKDYVQAYGYMKPSTYYKWMGKRSAYTKEELEEFFFLINQNPDT